MPKKVTPKTQYSDQEKATALAALDANGGNIAKTAKQLGMPRLTLSDWEKGRGIHPEVADIHQDKTKSLSEKLDAIAHKLADVLPGKIEGASLMQIATAMAISIDKAQLLKGEPTAINHNVQLSNSERLARIAALSDRIRARRAG